MVIQKNFIRFASLCCFISVITTLGIHAFFPDPPASFDERILLFRNTDLFVKSLVGDCALSPGNNCDVGLCVIAV